MDPLPDSSAVRAALDPGAYSDPSRVERLLTRATTAAHRHTGGAGFTADGTWVEPEIAAVIVNSVCRALANPELSLVGDEDAFDLRPGSFADWSYAENAVLERYRVAPPSPQARR